MNFELITKKNINEAVLLFDDPEFLFLTKYPKFVPEKEIELFLLSKQTYLIKKEDKVIGLGLFNNYTCEHGYFRFKLIKNIDYNMKLKLLKEFLNIIRDKNPELVRIQTEIFEFDTEDIEFYGKSGLCKEMIDKDNIIYNKKKWDTITYSLINKEINEFLNR
ncbi:hypothetical protein PV797_16195 [Clostridiaceae bacterium M8S5]|nr:hypothetical protein PV797_16195 [Clostridiaceae bacterium M8S5]